MTITSLRAHSIIAIVGVALGGLWLGCGGRSVSGQNNSTVNPNCGNGHLDPGETCDGDCPGTCDDQDPCTVDTRTGTASTCNVLCDNDPIEQCTDGDGCCPAGCSISNDDDCSAVCGDGLLEGVETCDPPEACPTDCEDFDVCTTDTLTGSAEECTAVCQNAPIVSCISGDGCCPPGCDDATDDDCICEIPNYPTDCSQIPYFQCGFWGECLNGQISVNWHEHVSCAGEEQIIDFSCTYQCPNGCLPVDGWPADGAQLIADYCVP